MSCPPIQSGEGSPLPRWRKPPPKVLSLPTSARVVECYAVEGKAYVHRPLFGEAAEILLIDSARAVMTVQSRNDYGAVWPTEPCRRGSGRSLGGACRMAPCATVSTTASIPR